MFLNLYEQPSEELNGLGVVRLATTKDLPQYVAIDVGDGPAYLDDEQVQKLIAFLVTWRQFTTAGTPTTPEHPVFNAGR